MITGFTMKTIVNIILDIFSGIIGRFYSWIKLYFLERKANKLEVQVGQLQELEAKRKAAEEDYKNRIKSNVIQIHKQQEKIDKRPIDTKRRTDFENLS